MIRLTDVEIRENLHRDLPIMEAYAELCKAQLKKVLRERNKHTDFWKDLEREVQ